MATSDDVKAILAQLAIQGRAIEKLLELGAKPTPMEPSPTTDHSAAIQSLARTVNTFSGEVMFDDWYSRYEDVFCKDGGHLSDEERVRLLLRKLSDEKFQVYRNHILPKKPAECKYEDTVATLKSLFAPRESLFAKRLKCLRAEKSAVHDFSQHSGLINRLCEGFDVAKVTPDIFKALMFIISLKDQVYSDIVTRLLLTIEQTDESKVNLELMVTEANRVTNLKVDTASVGKRSPAQVQAVSIAPKKRNQHRARKNSSATATKSCTSPCWLCGNLHYSKDCTFKSNRCKDCKTVGHKDGYCVSAQQAASSKQCNVIQVLNTCTQSRKFVVMEIAGMQVKLQHDSGSDCTIISKRNWELLNSPSLSPPPSAIKDAQKKDLGILGFFIADLQCKGHSGRGRVFVAPFELNLFGMETIETLDLWSVPPSNYCLVIDTFDRTQAAQSIKKEFADLFQPTLGFCVKATAKLELLPGAARIFKEKRPVPYGVMDKVEKELNRLQSLGVITPVDSSEWAAPVVVVKKANGEIRICGDYSTGLNSVIAPNLYPIPTLEELYSRLVNGRVFATIDLSDAYLQIGVCEESRKMLTIHTHRGLFNFNRLAPGVRAAPGIFQRITDQLVAGLDNVVAYFDDICVAGEDEPALFQSIKRVLMRIREFGFHIRADKCKFFCDEVKFLGNIINSSGIHVDPEKTSAVRRLPPPHNEKTLRSFLGAVNYYGKYIKSMGNLTAPMSHLLKKDTPWKWTSQCQSAFEKFKEILQSDLVLCHY